MMVRPPPLHPGLDFSASHQLITHKDFTNELDKKCAVFLSQHGEGCLICLYFLNRFGKKFIILPHLNHFSGKTSSYFPSKNSRFCPSLLRLDQASRLELVNKIKELCAGCLGRRGANLCRTCNMRNHITCKMSQKHPYLCSCAQCVSFTASRIQTYNTMLSKGPDMIKNLKLDQSDNRLLPPVPVLLSTPSKGRSPNLTESDSIDTREIIENMSEQLAPTKSAVKNVFEDVTDSDIFGFLKHMDKVDIQITTPTPIMMSKIKSENNKPSFKQMMGSGRVKVAGGVPYYFFIKLLTNHSPPKSLNCVLDTGSMATVCQSKYLTNQDYFLM